MFVGYGKSILGTLKAPFTIYDYYSKAGVSWNSTKQLLSGSWDAFWGGLTGNDPVAFGESFGTILQVAAGGGAKLATSVPRPPVVIGESMGRVQAAASYAGAETYGGLKLPMVKNTALWNKQPLKGLSHAHNAGWIAKMKLQKRVIYDVGKDTSRKAPSSYYRMERRILGKYPKRVDKAWPPSNISAGHY